MSLVGSLLFLEDLCISQRHEQKLYFLKHLLLAGHPLSTVLRYQRTLGCALRVFIGHVSWVVSWGSADLGWRVAAYWLI